MGYLKQNWLSIIPLALIAAYLGTTIVTKQCASCVLIDAFIGTPSETVAVSTSWETKLIDGSPIGSSELRETVNVVVYFATWCGPCKDEVPHLVALRNSFDDKDVTILAISMDQAGKELKPFVKHYGINYKIARNSPSLDECYGPIKYLPTILIIDKDGTIAHRHTGAVSEDTLKTQVRTLLMKEA